MCQAWCQALGITVELDVFHSLKIIEIKTNLRIKKNKYISEKVTALLVWNPEPPRR
jgi:hypothetical protein